MDNLTHSFVGAILGQMGLKRRTGLAMPALIIGANLPDIDGLCVVFGLNTLTARRGLTHGPVAMMLLPLLLTGALLLWARWRPNADRPPIHGGWLLALAYTGMFTHPAMDWLNSYGIRLLSPFSDQWFAGDTLFIIDLWIWIALIGGWWISRRREKGGRADWRTPAIASFTAVCTYIFANGLITGHAEAITPNSVYKSGFSFAFIETPECAKPGACSSKRLIISPDLVVANPVPVAFWRREVLWRGQDMYGVGQYSLLGDLESVGEPLPTGMNDPRVALAAKRNSAARAFLFWSRMPIAKVDAKDLILTDQRFTGSITRGNFTVRVPLETLK
ncbi:MAG: metal-dependent hydrolase [Pseudomonadota bacterium]